MEESALILLILLINLRSFKKGREVECLLIRKHLSLLLENIKWEPIMLKKVAEERRTFMN